MKKGDSARPDLQVEGGLQAKDKGGNLIADLPA